MCETIKGVSVRDDREPDPFISQEKESTRIDMDWAKSNESKVSVSVCLR